MDDVTKSVLCINGGSSSIKACFFDIEGKRQNFHYRFDGKPSESDFRHVMKTLSRDLKGDSPAIVAHRFVHGGEVKDNAREITPQEFKRLKSIVHLAPLHLPMNLLGALLCSKLFPVKQIACFDNAFHQTMPAISRALPIPRKENIRRFGFHGLSYAYLASRLEALIGDRANGRVILAHLGSGSSLCMLKNLKSIDTTMGYTPDGGVCMGTRSGDLDPGVMLELSRRYKFNELSNLVNQKMGLLALSDGLSSNMEVLLKSSKPKARFAIDYFCRDITSTIGGMAAKAGGVDAIVFSGGIGENSSYVRSKICDPLQFMDIKLDKAANKGNAIHLNALPEIPVLCIKTDEELMMKNLSCEF